MTSDKKWHDQPDCVLEADDVCSVSVGELIVEVRKERSGTYLVTTGTLFGSQTIRCENVDAVFAVIQIANDGKRKGGVDVPEGCELLDNPKPTINA